MPDSPGHAKEKETALRDCGRLRDRLGLLRAHIAQARFAYLHSSLDGIGEQIADGSLRLQSAREILQSLAGELRDHETSLGTDKSGAKAARRGQEATPRGSGRKGTQDLWLDPIPTVLRAQAIAAFERGDADGFLGYASNEESLALVAKNQKALLARAIYEAALMQAFTAARTNNTGWSLDELRRLFSVANRGRLRAAGDPLPGPGPFVLYRGVAGPEPRRCVRGYSWTDSLEIARWFAERYAEQLGDAGVYRVTVKADAVLAYVHEGGRTESEYIVELPRTARPERVGGGK